MDVLLDGPYGGVLVDVYGSRGAHVVPLAEGVGGQGGWRKSTGDPSVVSRQLFLKCIVDDRR
ncbi:hypothetical protein GN244_ATG10834 [Phytophthora infestans]|uniref:Uncharacterized protein n=1 Tax=Phytophthora infestans TaxID=4787 RepID=A0A833SQ55_PHYIN|nr:hypothetical protein GN244_ATG10834 [Phytophthora infestans]